MTGAFEVIVEGYVGPMCARAVIDLGVWESSHGEALRSTLHHLAGYLGVVELDAWLARGERVRVFGGKVHGGPADGDTWERDHDHWRLPVAAPLLALDASDDVVFPHLRTANYRWQPAGWEWDGFA